MKDNVCIINKYTMKPVQPDRETKRDLNKFGVYGMEYIDKREKKKDGSYA